MSETEEKFEQGDSGASDSYPLSVGSILISLKSESTDQPKLTLLESTFSTETNI